MRFEEIIQKHMRNSVRQHGEGFIAPVLKPIDARRYVADCLEAGFQISGVSGFHYFEDGKIQPDQSFELDAEDFDTLEQFLKMLGGQILSQLHKNVVFEISFDV